MLANLVPEVPGIQIFRLYSLRFCLIVCVSCPPVLSADTQRYLSVDIWWLTSEYVNFSISKMEGTYSLIHYFIYPIHSKIYGLA